LIKKKKKKTGFHRVYHYEGKKAWLVGLSFDASIPLLPNVALLFELGQYFQPL